MADYILSGCSAADLTKEHFERINVKYICFHLPHDGDLQEPDIEIEHDTYRSYGRGEIQMPQIFEDKQE